MLMTPPALRRDGRTRVTSPASPCFGSTYANSFIMNGKYKSLLTPAQLKVKEALHPLHYLAGDADVRESPMWPVIKRLLTKFGWDEEQEH